MHLPKEMIRQPPIIIQPRQIRATNIADLQLLMSRRSRSIRQSLEFAIPLIPLNLRNPDPMELLHSKIHRAFLSHDLNLLQPNLNRPPKIRDRLEQLIRLPNLLGRLLQPPLRLINPPIAVPHEPANIPPVVEFERPLALLHLVRCLVLFAEIRLVGFWAGTEVLLCVGEEIVRAAAAEVGAADFGVGDGEGGLFGGAGYRHHAVAH